MMQPASSAVQGTTVVPGKIQTMPAYLLKRFDTRCRVLGFTLIELMVTLAVAAILAMIAVPSFKHILYSTNLAGVNNDLVGDLQYARTEAVSRQVHIAVEASSGDWKNGWTVNIPPATTTGGATAEVLRRHAAVSDQYEINAGSDTKVTYAPQGTLDSPATGACFTIFAPDGEHNQAHFLQVLPAGMVQQTTGNTVPSGSSCAAPTP